MVLYGLKSSGYEFREFLTELLDNMGFKSSISDMGVWIRPFTKSYYEHNYDFILVYVDDPLEISQDAVSVKEEVTEKFI